MLIQYVYMSVYFNLCKAGKDFEIQFPNGPVHLSFQLPPPKCYLPNRCTMFMPYQLTRL